MKLIDLISFFRRGGTYESFCKDNLLNVESEVIEIYAQEPVSLQSNLGFFSIENTKGQIEYLFDGKRYRNLFDFFYFLEVMEDLKISKEMPQDAELAQTLLSYALNDA
jgi:hypothetical protein